MKSFSFTLAPEAGPSRVAFLPSPSRCVQHSSSAASPAQPAVVGAAHGAQHGECVCVRARTCVCARARVCMCSSSARSPGTSPHPALSSIIRLSTGSGASPTSSSCELRAACFFPSRSISELPGALFPCLGQLTPM